MKRTPTTRTHLLKLEADILALSGLKIGSELLIKDYPLDPAGKEFIHCTISGFDNPKTLIMLHGYLASNIIFLRMLGELSQFYRVICIDLPGMSLSSRSDFSFQTEEEGIEYFISALEKFRELLAIDSFVLAGHSFGGYISCLYALRHQNRVTKLLLFSPAGITKKECCKEAFQEHVSQQKLLMKCYYKVYGYVWERKVTPFEVVRKTGLMGRIVLKKKITKIFSKVFTDENEKRLVTEFFDRLVDLPASSEKALYTFFEPLAFAKKPLEDEICSKLKINLSFFYGETDWMDAEGAKRVQGNYGGKSCKLNIVPDSGHQLTLERPDILTRSLIEEVYEDVLLMEKVRMTKANPFHNGDDDRRDKFREDYAFP
eukprot:TRINITY_DN7902_c0_g1_i2.p1 TRINITY_DN7902_c0_g1~~TRINITY_DN7902_c0_g1_i2.p1  ORF type:complete len:372 (-),score=55.93 TRINITY_DN7902_c0_g1_i2:334-1449(-)